MTGSCYGSWILIQVVCNFFIHFDFFSCASLSAGVVRYKNISIYREIIQNSMVWKITTLFTHDEKLPKGFFWSRKRFIGKKSRYCGMILVWNCATNILWDCLHTALYTTSSTHRCIQLFYCFFVTHIECNRVSLSLAIASHMFVHLRLTQLFSSVKLLYFIQ